VVACPLAPSVPHLLSSSCSSPRAFGLGFLQTPPRDDALALFLAFGSAHTWRKDFHLTSSVPCPAHTSEFRRRRLAVACNEKLACFSDTRGAQALSSFLRSLRMRQSVP
jgi:hypothetical protein